LNRQGLRFADSAAVRMLRPEAAEAGVAGTRARIPLVEA
jgi:hypothetical protein